MSVFKKTALATMTVLVALMIVRDPDQAHRPPDLRPVVAVTTTMVTV